MKNRNIFTVKGKKPDAIARVKGSDRYPELSAIVKFYQTNAGVIVEVYASGLPKNNRVCKKPIFAMHIHRGGSCTGNETDCFANAMTHYNPSNCDHPYHAGDMPPLFGVNGYAFSMFLTDRFTVQEVVGRSVIIHSGPDDFTTQPSGNAGEKIACGIII